MRTIKVYRFEDDEGRGMYTAPRRTDPRAGYVRFPDMYDNTRNPCPEEDYPLMNDIDAKGLPDINTESWRYGFRSIKQMKRWTQKKSWRSDLQNLGLKLSVYEVPVSQAALGETQVVFQYQSAKHIGHIDAVTL